MKNFFAVLTAVLISLSSLALADDAAPTVVKIETSMGDMIVELDAAAAPITVANFLTYAEAGQYYRGTIHRVVPGYLIQGGGFSKGFLERPIRDPIQYEGDNGLKNERGTIAMARHDDPNSAAAQWFINLTDNPKLDHRVTDLGPIYGYSVFGQVIAGMDVADAISAVATGPGGPFESEVPLEPVIIIDVTRTQAPAP